MTDLQRWEVSVTREIQQRDGAALLVSYAQIVEATNPAYAIAVVYNAIVASDLRGVAVTGHHVPVAPGSAIDVLRLVVERRS